MHELKALWILKSIFSLEVCAATVYLHITHHAYTNYEFKSQRIPRCQRRLHNAWSNDTHTTSRPERRRPLLLHTVISVDITIHLSLIFVILHLTDSKGMIRPQPYHGSWSIFACVLTISKCNWDDVNCMFNCDLIEIDCDWTYIHNIRY